MEGEAEQRAERRRQLDMEERGKTYEGDDEAVCRAWIEDVLGKKLEGDSLLDCLRSGVALCEVLKVLNPSFKCKISASSMPFPQVQTLFGWNSYPA